ncbi:MAG: class I SAM-dependent methyltransferase [Rhodothermaceae bacterium]|nr:class I SAM-dependent methyltransferase [Rhodothermaceae bacterium]
MKNETAWKPTKFVQTRRGLRASRDRQEVYVGSRISADGAAAALELALQKHARGRLLDLGAGKAPLYGVYRPLVDEVVCIDWEESLHGTSYLDLTADLNEGLPLPDAAFDTVLSTSVFEHLRSPELAWAEAARVLRPGGALIVHVPFLYWLHEEPHDYFRYTEHALRAYAERSGLRVVELKATGGGLAALADLVARFVAPLPWLCAAHVAASQAVLRSAWGRKLSSSERARRLPLGYCLVAVKA